MVHHSTLFLATAGFILLSFTEALTPGGTNVCTRQVPVTIYSSVADRRVGYENYRTCCKRFLRACVSRCTRSRTKWVTYYKQVGTPGTRPVYFCCPGWNPAGSVCTIPKCDPPCKNGACIAPGKCQCRAGFVGNRCETDVDECASKPCQQTCNNLPGSYSCACTTGYVKVGTDPKSPKCNDVDECTTRPCTCLSQAKSCVATCSNTQGSFQCSCNAGYLLGSGNVCRDVDECATPSVHRCHQRCLNSIGSFSCACNSGYLLAPDGKQCNDVNECSKLNGGCQQICSNKPGSFACSCQVGFRIRATDVSQCDEIDECAEGTPCDVANGICTNTRGSYTCSCKTGYALQADGKTCVDIDECSRNDTNSCQHFCHNNAGSYTCSCKLGFRLNSDGRACDDINECQEGSDTCQHNCHNNVASYTCSCRPGYILEADKRACRALPCVAIESPRFGSMNCSGLVTDEACDFYCDIGYNLFGSSNRMCLPSTAWEGEETECKPKSCPRLVPPSHGSVLTPCVEEFSSKCLIRCQSGFFLEAGSSALCVVGNTGSTVWTGKNITCQANTVCVPNPCRHDGVCRDVSTSAYSCDCSGTGYEGDRCQVGLLSISPIPRLEVGALSDLITITAFPDTNIKVTITSDDASFKFIPPSVSIVYPVTSSQFRILPSKAGASRISYQISGTSGGDFKVPPSDVVFSYIKRPDSEAVFLDANFYNASCHSTTFMNCPAGDSLSLSSTCAWTGGSAGFISASSGSAAVPLSPVGITTATALATRQGQILDPSAEVRGYLDSQALAACPTGSECSGTPMNLDAVDYIAGSNLFMRAYLSVFNLQMPFGARLRVAPSAHGYSVNNLKAILGKGDQLSAFCPGMAFKASSIYTLLQSSSPSMLQIMSATKQIDERQLMCAAIDMCQKGIYFSVPISKSISFTTDLQYLGLPDIKVSVSGFGITENPKTTCANFGVANDTSKCVSANAFAHVAASFNTSSSSRVTMDGRVDVESSMTSEIFLSKFDSPHRMLMKGKASCIVDMPLLGNSLQFSAVDDEARVLIELGGGNSLSCPKCNNKGVFVNVNAKKSSFMYSSSVIRFLPSLGSVYTYLPMEISGGTITAWANSPQLKLQLTLLSRFQSQVLGMKAMLSVKFSKDYGVIAAQTLVFTQKVTAVNTLLTNATTQEGFKALFISVEQLKVAAMDVEATINSFSGRLGSDALSTSIRRRLRFLTLRLKQVSTLEVAGSNIPIDNASQGAVVSYVGAICFHKLCFSDCTVTIDSSNSSTDTTTIAVVPKIDLRLSDGILLVAGERAVFELGNTIETLKSSFEVNLSLFGSVYKASMSITETSVSVQAGNVTLTDKLSFVVTASDAIVSATWDGLVRRIKGEADKSSTMTLELSNLSETWFQTTGETTKRRLSRALDNSKRNEADAAQQSADVDVMRARLANVTRQAKTAVLLYRRQLLLLNRSQENLRTELPQINQQFIERDLDGVCVLKTCPKVCRAFTTCKLCQYPVFVDADTLECVQIKENIRTSEEVTYSTKCSVEKVIFQTVYTGSCPEDRNMQAKRNQELEQNLVATGAAIGATIGSVIPIIGTALGSVIGAVVGFIAGLFKSCDRSYEVYENRFNVLEDCIKMRVQLKTIERFVSKCDTKRVRVQTGFSQPKECNCNLVPCFARVTDAICVQDNAACQRQRAEHLEGSATIPKVFTDKYNKIQQLKVNVKVAQVKVRQLEEERNSQQRELNRQLVFLQTKQQEATISKDTAANLASAIPSERCVAGFYNQSMNLSTHLSINGLSFETGLPIIGSFQLDARIRLHQTGKDIDIPLRIDLEDADLSLQGSAKKIIISSLCKDASTRRRRRSAGGEEITDADTVFTSWYEDSLQNVDVPQMACMTFRKTTNFIGRLSKDLEAISKEVQSLSNLVASSRATFPAVSVAFNSDSSNSFVQAESSLINTLEDSLSKLAGRATPSEAIVLWKQRAEIFTFTNNFTVCLNFEDCVELAFNSLKRLPSMLKVSKDSFIRLVNKTEGAMSSLQSDQLTFANQQRKVKEVSDLLQKMSAYSLHCAAPPNVSMVATQNITVRKGDKVSLSCVAKSELPLLGFAWKKHGKVVNVSHGSQFQFKASEKDDGVYSCEGISMSGRRESTGVSVIVNAPPTLRSQPRDVNFVVPRENEFNPVFVCNVTGKPDPEIQWFFISFNSTSRNGVAMVNGSSSTLRISNPTTENAGYYYCTANNSIGDAAISRKVRLNVLKRELSGQSLTFCFNVHGNSNLTTRSFDNLPTQMKVSNEQNIESTLTKDTEMTGVLCGGIRARPNTSVDDSPQTLVGKASTTRQNMAQSLANLIQAIVLNNSTLSTVDDDVVAVDNESISYSFQGNHTRPGYVTQANGFSSVQCPQGTYATENQCLECPPNTYQSEPGSAACNKCPIDLVTEENGATNIGLCIKPSSARMSIVFLIESTRTLFWNRHAANNLVLELISRHLDMTKVKIAVIHYGSFVDVLFGLGEYTEIGPIKKILFKDHRFDHDVRTNEAFEEAEYMLSSVKEGKKFIVVISSGKTTNHRSMSGFYLAREAALMAMEANTTVISVANGKRYNKEGVLSIASYPKTNHVIRLEKKPVETAQKVYDVIASTFEDVCYDAAVDIAVIIGETRSCIHRSQVRLLAQQLARELSKISQALSKDTAVGLFDRDSHSPFEEIHSGRRLEQELRGMLGGNHGGGRSGYSTRGSTYGRYQSSSNGRGQGRGHGRGGNGRGQGRGHGRGQGRGQGRGHGRSHGRGNGRGGKGKGPFPDGLHLLVEEVYNEHFNEQQGAIANFKAALIVSCNPLNEDVLFDFERAYPSEVITSVNVVLDDNSSVTDDSFMFRMSDVDRMISTLEEQRNKARMCNRR